MDTNTIHTGDAAETLRELPAESVHMAMTSPPYFGLRDYDVDGQIGLEESLDEYISKLVGVFRELWRVLRPDGSVWLNLGDSYAQSGKSNHDKSGTAPDGQGHSRGHDAGAFGPKNKMLVPHRVAIALQEDGWIVRNDVTWVKPNPMPQSVKDRLNTTTEQIFHLVKDREYWYDLDAIREAHKANSRERMEHDFNPNVEGRGTNDTLNPDELCHPSGKNPGDVFEVTTKPFPDAHFAVYPPELCEKPLKATCPPKVCAECGTPYERVALETEEIEVGHGGKAKEGNRDESRGDHGKGTFYSEIKTEWEWKRACDCATDATKPGIALDPFAGAGTTCLKAKELGRHFVGIELNPEYADMARARIGLSPHDPSNVRDDDNQSGLEAYADGGDP